MTTTDHNNKMKLLLTALTILFVVFDNMEVGQACSSCHNTHHHHSRRKRDAASEATFQKLKNLLKTFNEELLAKLKPDLEHLTPEERTQFNADLEGVSIAAEAQLSGLISEFGNRLTPKELVQAVVHIMGDFGEKSWLKRIRALSGKKFENLIKDFIDRVEKA